MEKSLKLDYSGYPVNVETVVEYIFSDITLRREKRIFLASFLKQINVIGNTLKIG